MNYIFRGDELILIEGFLKYYDNIIPFVDSFTPVVALIISMIAYLESKKKSKIILRYKTGDSDEYKQNKYFKNKKNIIELSAREKYVENKENIICIENDLNLVIENISSTVAKNPVVNLRFVNLTLKSLNFYAGDIELERNYNWWKIETDNNYSEFRWEPKDGTVIHKGINIIEKLNIKTVRILELNTYAEVILSADNMKTKKFNIPIKIIDK